MIAAEAARLLGAAGLVYPVVTPDADRARAWADILGEVTFTEGTSALKTHAATSSLPPSPADILRIVKASRTDAAQRRAVGEQARHACPRPANYAAMSAAWNDPVRFAAERTRYHDQLVAAGHGDCIRRTS